MRDFNVVELSTSNIYFHQNFVPLRWSQNVHRFRDHFVSVAVCPGPSLYCYVLTDNSNVRLHLPSNSKAR